MNLSILSWNARSIKVNPTNNKLLILRHHLQSNFYHLILIQETWLDSNCNIFIPNYTCIRKDHISPNKHANGGVLIFVHSSISFEKVNFVNSLHSDAVFVRVSVGNRNIIIGSIYSSPSLSCLKRKSDYEKLLSRPGPFIFAGDFNAKHQTWNNTKYDLSGSHLKKLIDSYSCDVSFTDSPTIYPTSKGGPSFLDISTLR